MRRPNDTRNDHIDNALVNAALDGIDKGDTLQDVAGDLSEYADEIKDRIGRYMQNPTEAAREAFTDKLSLIKALAEALQCAMWDHV